ncbi:MAG: glycoside hydrolase family 43 protein [Prevotella sp.]|nr:glycoside hydrolase family 43 protein [Prevotella sp.]
MTTKKLLLMVCATLCTMFSYGRDAYLFSYFRGEKDGLHLAYSYDGLHWHALNGNESLLKPEVGDDRLMRDPSIVQGPDGTFHMVWTSSWHDRIIGYSSSRDLIHWTEQRAIPVMADEPTASNCWAPELFYDEPTRTFYIFWATSIPGRHHSVGSLEGKDEWNHRIYCTTTKDFKSFTPTRLYFNPDFNVIDAAVVRIPGKRELIMVVKNETSNPAQKNIRLTRSRSMKRGFPTKVSAPITGKYWAEGPAPLYVGDTLYVYFDKYMEGRYGAVRSLDNGKTWTDVSDQVSFPEGIRHGTAFRVDDTLLRSLRIATGDKTCASTSLTRQGR